MGDAIALATDATVTTVLAAYLNAAMARDAMARKAYRAIYGAEWESLGNGTEIADGKSTQTETKR